jgi:hypothetical protein
MWKPVMLAFASVAFLGAPVFAADLPNCRPRPNSPLADANFTNAELSQLTRDTRDRLLRSPGDIAAVVAEADAAPDVLTRGQIELGILKAAQYLRRVDTAGYQVMEDYLNTHPDDAVVEDLQSALCSTASAQPPASPTAANTPSYSAPPSFPSFPGCIGCVSPQ